MAYEKRLCVLKQIKKGFTADGEAPAGAVFAERLDGTLTVTPRLAGLAAVSEGRYALAVWAGGKTYCFEWKDNRPFSVSGAPSLEGGFSALVAFVRGGAEPVAYGSCGNAPADPALLLSLFSEKKKGGVKPIPVPLSPNQTPIPAPNVPLAPTVPLPDEEDGEPFRDAAASGYDDEAIASDDYYLREGAEDAPLAAPGKETADGAAARADEEDGAPSPFRLSCGGLTYYNEIAPKLKEAFRKYPKDERLLAVFPHSEWVRTEAALLGVVYAEGRPRYLCVAMETVPPPEAEPFAVFVPASCFSDDDGVYVVFQDAGTGEYVKVESA